MLARLWSTLTSAALFAAIAWAGVYEFDAVRRRMPDAASTWAGYQAIGGLVVMSLGSLAVSLVPQRPTSPRNPPARIAALLAQVAGGVALISGAAGVVYLLAG